MTSFVLESKVLPEQDYGFLTTPDGRQIHFCRNSVLNDAYDKLEIGTEISFAEEEGNRGPQRHVHWWGVMPWLVRKWRRALGVPRWNEGDLRLKVAIGKSPVMRTALAAKWAKARDPDRRAKIAAASRDGGSGTGW